MSLNLNLNIDNTINFAFSADEAEKAILKTLKEKNLDGNFEVDLKIVGVKEIHMLNEEYRDIDKPTDVLSFPIYEKIEHGSDVPILLGDIVICPEMAEEPLMKLIEHSTLHLLGFHHAGD
jgi:probable rRNA maturation factor